MLNTLIIIPQNSYWYNKISRNHNIPMSPFVAHSWRSIVKPFDMLNDKANMKGGLKLVLQSEKQLTTHTRILYRDDYIDMARNWMRTFVNTSENV